MTEAEYIGSELQAADAMRIVHEKRISELEAVLRQMRDDLRNAHLGEGCQLNLRDIADRIAVALK